MGKYVIAKVTELMPNQIESQIALVATMCADERLCVFPFHTLNGFFQQIPKARRLYLENPFAVYANWAAGPAGDEPMSKVAIRNTIHEFTNAGESIKEFFDEICKFSPVKSNLFTELYAARKAIMTEAIKLNTELSSLATKRADLVRLQKELDDANSDLSVLQAKVKETKLEIQWTDTEGVNNLICKGCHKTCHRECKLPFDSNNKTKMLEQCECFVGVKKTFKIKSEADKTVLLSNVQEDRMNASTYETYAVAEKRPFVVSDKNFNINGVECVGMLPESIRNSGRLPPLWNGGHFFGARDGSGYHSNVNVEGLGIFKNMCIPCDVLFEDRSGFQMYDMNPCSHCKCPLKDHEHAEGYYHEERVPKFGEQSTVHAEYKDASNIASDKVRAKRAIDTDIKRMEAREEVILAQLKRSLEDYQKKSLAKNYAMVLNEQEAYVDLLIKNDQKNGGAMKEVLEKQKSVIISYKTALAGATRKRTRA